MIVALILVYCGAGMHNVLTRWARLGSPALGPWETIQEFFFWPRNLYEDFKR